jgi:hypothetical protein
VEVMNDRSISRINIFKFFLDAGVGSRLQPDVVLRGRGSIGWRISTLASPKSSFINVLFNLSILIALHESNDFTIEKMPVVSVPWFSDADGFWMLCPKELLSDDS